MEEKGLKGPLSVLNIPNSIFLFEPPRFIIPWFFSPAVLPTLFVPSPMIDAWEGQDEEWSVTLLP